jgi:hypothetical protein
MSSEELTNIRFVENLASQERKLARDDMDEDINKANTEITDTRRQAKTSAETRKNVAKQKCWTESKLADRDYRHVCQRSMKTLELRHVEAETRYNIRIEKIEDDLFSNQTSAILNDEAASVETYEPAGDSDDATTECNCSSTEELVRTHLKRKSEFAVSVTERLRRKMLLKDHGAHVVLADGKAY